MNGLIIKVRHFLLSVASVIHTCIHFTLWSLPSIFVVWFIMSNPNIISSELAFWIGLSCLLAAALVTMFNTDIVSSEEAETDKAIEELDD